MHANNVLEDLADGEEDSSGAEVDYVNCKSGFADN
jgi:hypothetical protein